MSCSCLHWCRGGGRGGSRRQERSLLIFIVMSQCPAPLQGRLTLQNTSGSKDHGTGDVSNGIRCPRSSSPVSRFTDKRTEIWRERWLGQCHTESQGWILLSRCIALRRCPGTLVWPVSSSHNLPRELLLVACHVGANGSPFFCSMTAGTWGLCKTNQRLLLTPTWVWFSK